MNQLSGLILKLPVRTSLLIEARCYALESIEHTMDYDGWQDGHKKLERITVGKYMQIWVAEYCRLNSIDCKLDSSSPYEPDKHDLVINGVDIDVKASTIKGLCGQVSNHIEKQKEGTCFVFFGTDKNLSYVEPYGGCTREFFLNNAVKVNHGELIPNTRWVQKFKNGSYFIDIKKLTTFSKFINGLNVRGAC